MKTKAIAAQRISRQMHAIEDDIDGLLGKIGEAISEISSARVDFDVDANEMQRVLLRLTSGQAELVQLRMKAIGAHSDLRKFAEPRGDFPFKCPDQEIGEGEGSLREVA